MLGAAVNHSPVIIAPVVSAAPTVLAVVAGCPAGCKRCQTGGTGMDRGTLATCCTSAAWNCR